MSTENSTGLNAKFSNRIMKDLVGFSTSYVQTVVDLDIDDGNAEDIETNNAVVAMLNGTIIPSLTADAASVIANGLQGSIWLTAQSYTVNMVRFVEDANGQIEMFVCITDHTSSAANKPRAFSGGWEAYWKAYSATARTAVGATVASGKSRYFLVCSEADFELSVWLAGDAATDGSETFDMPNIETEIFIPVGWIHVNSNTAFVLGTTALTTIGTFGDFVGPVYPKALHRDRN